MSVPPGIRSRPTYAGLRPVPAARRHLVAAEPDALPVVLALLDRALAEGLDGFAARTEVVLAGADGADVLRERGLTVHGGLDGLDQREALGTLDTLLAGATMGTRLYAAGTEGFVGRVVRLGADHGIDPRSVLTEHAGSLARRVQCVHCKTFLEPVTTSYVECAGCGLVLLVRDHFSRRLAAFQGVCANAEDRSETPTPEEVFA